MNYSNEIFTYKFNKGKKLSGYRTKKKRNNINYNNNNIRSYQSTKVVKRKNKCNFCRWSTHTLKKKCKTLKKKQMKYFICVWINYYNRNSSRVKRAKFIKRTPKKERKNFIFRLFNIRNVYIWSSFFHLLNFDAQYVILIICTQSIQHETENKNLKQNRFKICLSFQMCSKNRNFC